MQQNCEEISLEKIFTDMWQLQTVLDKLIVSSVSDFTWTFLPSVENDLVVPISAKLDTRACCPIHNTCKTSAQAQHCHLSQSRLPR